VFGGGYSPETPIAGILILFTQILSLAIFVRSILSWFNMDPHSPLIQMLDAVTDPIIAPIRQIMPRLGMIDFSPLVAILLLQFGGAFLAQIIDQQFAA
jgi:YggT family protein